MHALATCVASRWRCCCRLVPPGLFIGALRRRLLIGARLNAFVNCDLCRIARASRGFSCQWRSAEPRQRMNRQMKGPVKVLRSFHFSYFSYFSDFSSTSTFLTNLKKVKNIFISWILWIYRAPFHRDIRNEWILLYKNQYKFDFKTVENIFLSTSLMISKLMRGRCAAILV